MIQQFDMRRIVWNVDEAGEVTFVDALGARLAVYVEGEAQDEPIILLHGGSGVPDYLADVARSLSLKHRGIRYDQRGTGRSSVHDRRFALGEQVEDLETIRETYGHEPERNRLSASVNWRFTASDPRAWLRALSID